MLLLNHDFYDIYAVMIRIRFKQLDSCNIDIIKKLRILIDTPQQNNYIDSNLVRKTLSGINSLNQDEWSWVFAYNIYTYGTKIIKDNSSYHIMSSVLTELEECLIEQNEKRIFYLTDAVHNWPIYFADGCKNLKKVLNRDVKLYRKKWNKSFLRTELK